MLASEGVPVVQWGLFIILGLAAVVAAFVVTYMIVATVVLGIVRMVRGPSDPDLT